jgi:WG containing repeat
MNSFTTLVSMAIPKPIILAPFLTLCSTGFALFVVLACLDSPATRLSGPASVLTPGLVSSTTPQFLDPDINSGIFTDYLSYVEAGRCGSYVATPNKGGQIYLEPIQFGNAGDFSEGLARVPIDGKCGYIDLDGKQVIPARFTRASDFRGGLAAIRQGDLWGFINTRGQVTIAPQFDRASDFIDGVAIVQVKGKQGMINPEGEWLIPPKFTTLSSCHDGLSVARQSGHYGYIDRSGRWMILPQFLYADDFHDGAVRIDAGGPGVYFINRQGQRITQPGQFSSARSFSNGVASVAIEKNGQEYRGLIDLTGTLIVPYRREDFTTSPTPELGENGGFSEGLRSFQRDQKWGFMDTTGGVAIVPQFDEVSRFHEGRAKVRLGKDWAYCDRTGKVIARGVR